MKCTSREYVSIYHYYCELEDGLQHYKALWREARCPGNFRDWAKVYCPWVCEDFQELDRLAKLAGYLLNHPEKAYDDFSEEIIDRPGYVRPLFEGVGEGRHTGVLLGVIGPDHWEMRENTRIRGSVVPNTEEWDELARNLHRERDAKLLELIEKGEPISRRNYLDHTYGPGTQYSQKNTVPTPLDYLGRSTQSKKAPPTPVVTRVSKEPHKEEALVKTVRAMRPKFQPAWDAWLEVQSPKDFIDYVRPFADMREPFFEFIGALHKCCETYDKCAARTVRAWCEYVTENPSNEHLPMSSFVTWIEEKFPRLHTAVRRLNVVAEIVNEERQNYAHAVQKRKWVPFVSFAMREFKWAAERDNDTDMLQLIKRDFGPISREMVIRERFKGIPNSWSVGHERMLPYPFADLSKFTQSPLNPEFSEDGVTKLSGLYTEEYMRRCPHRGGEFQHPGNDYVPHDFVTQEVPEGCWWV